MPDLSFRIIAVEAAPFTSAPAISARLQITNAAADELIQSIQLNCQVQLQPRGRAYNALEETRLLDLFGERERWGSTMKPLLWANLVIKVPAFTGGTEVELLLPCSFDFDVAANKYFYGLNAGSVAVTLLFSGTAFYAGAHDGLQIAQIPWDREASFHLDIAVWKAAIGMHYPDAAWLRLSRDVFDRLYRYKVLRGIPMWDATVTNLLDNAERKEIAEVATEGGRQ